MWQKIILQSQRKKTLPDKGFLTLEIIIATLVAFAFLMSSLQALVLGMYLKVQAQEDQRANQLIQEDIEAFASLSSTLNLDLNTNCDPIDYNTSYAFGLWNSFDDTGTTAVYEPDEPVIISLLSGGGGAELTLNRTHVSAINGTAPFRTLGIYYQVRNNDNDLVASRYIEMIPDQALRCP
ncbi:MAG: hypothetical protein QNJ55_20390 [Xenococcus sp. MO_188.B8]|nr:hypothetical protein [Xenococcus sp. MO_188.B8]